MEPKYVQLQAKIEADSKFPEKLFGFESAEEVQNFLQEAGLEFSLADIFDLREAVVNAQATTDGELSDEALENVAGGGLGAFVGGIIGTLAPSPLYGRAW